MRFQQRPTAQRLPPVDPFGDSTERLRSREVAPSRDQFINTKVVGVRPRGTAEADLIGDHRQNVLEYIQSVGPSAFSGSPPEYWLKLVEEPSNAFDSDAVKVMLHSRAAEARGMTEGVHIGHIANGERICTNDSCKVEYERPLSSNLAILVCQHCGYPTKRDGLASQLKARAAEAGRSVEDHYEVVIHWNEDGTGGITGGGARTHGCNIRIQARS